jgi:hypothetical protein
MINDDDVKMRGKTKNVSKEKAASENNPLIYVIGGVD